MNKKKVATFGILAVALSIFAQGDACSTTTTSDDTQHQQQSVMLNEATKQTGMPSIINFTQRKQLKSIYEEVDKANLITYMYTQNEFDGKWVYQGEAIGYPIPYSTEYTNPEYVAQSTSYGTVTLPQADPDGLFHSQNTAGDWIMAINPETNKPEPQYMEPNVTVKESKIPAYLCESWSLPKGY